MATPFTILTGFLGAGKTTTVNRMLSAPGGRRIAVLVNELGRIAVDSQLILSRGGDVLELAGGCICCKVGDDLWDGIADVIARSKPDHVVLETTGIAEPDAIVEGFQRMTPEQRASVSLAGIVCAVDAFAGAAQLGKRDEARLQVVAADRIMITKLDVAAPDAVDGVHRALDELNPEAERASFPLGDQGTHALVPWILQTRRGRERTLHPHSHRHGQVSAATFTEEAPLLREPLMALVEQLRESLLRIKGFVHLANEERRAFVELAGGRVSLRLAEAWGDEPPRTELVLIGEDVDEAAIRRRLWACRAAG